MAWFEYIKNQGFFEPAQNPGPFEKSEGMFQVPFWEVLSYLERLSEEIQKGNSHEYIDEILDIIDQVSKHPKDNSRTWQYFIKILSKLPNDRVPKEILQHASVWLESRFDTALQTSELCTSLLPKFLNEQPSPADIAKAEILLRELLELKRLAKPKDIEVTRERAKGYASKAYPYILKTELLKKEMVNRVVSHCSPSIVSDLSRKVKLLLLDYPNGIEALIKDKGKSYEIKVFIELENLRLSIRERSTNGKLNEKHIENWESLDKLELRGQIYQILLQFDIDYTSTDQPGDLWKRLEFYLYNDMISELKIKEIAELSDTYTSRHELVYTYGLILRDLLAEQAKSKPEEAKALLKKIISEGYFGLPFLRRIAIYVIGVNWKSVKDAFWTLLSSDDPYGFFSNHRYKNEVYQLLKENQKELAAPEKEHIQRIINIGRKIEGADDAENHSAYWQHGWYSALKEIAPFKDKYAALSKQLNYNSSDHENEGRIIYSAEIAPMSSKELLEKSNKEIVEYILNFKPSGNWKSPSDSGLQRIFKEAIDSNPKKFTDDLGPFKKLNLSYLSNVISGLETAWKSEKVFSWKNVLAFCVDLIETRVLQINESEKGSGRNDSDWLICCIASLLTSGLQKDESSFESQLLPHAKEVIRQLILPLERVEPRKDEFMDFPTYSLNSTAGQCLRALVDYSLRRARLPETDTHMEKWEPDIKLLFESTMQKGIIDGHILLGWYIQQFYFLDEAWIKEQVQNHYDVGEREWKAFMGGFAASNIVFNKELYDLFRKHFERAIDANLKQDSFNNVGFTRHLTAFFFWGIEGLSPENLIRQFIDKSDADRVDDLITFIGQQTDYIKSLDELGRNDLLSRVLELWELLANKYEKPKSQKEEQNLSYLARWIAFYPSLNDRIIALLVKSADYMHHTHYVRDLIEELNRLKDIGDVVETAEYIAEILPKLHFRDYFFEKERDGLKSIVQFLFENGQGEVAKDFCNKMAREHQEFFLRELHDSYK